jgi:hypothetical protein
VRFTVAFKQFAGIKSPEKHPLLGRMEMSARAQLKDSSLVDLPVVNNAFEINDPNIVSLTFRFQSSLNLTGKDFFTLKIIQEFAVHSSALTGSLIVSLIPKSWLFEFLQDPLHDSRHHGTHPLLQYNDTTNTLTLNCLVIDLTDLWLDTHKDNRAYKHHALQWEKHEIDFRVLAFLGGAPLIWYVSIPVHLMLESRMSPHIFFSPSDNGEHQMTWGLDNTGSTGAKDLEYIRKGATEGGFDSDGKILMRYLLPPLDDDFVLARESDIDAAAPGAGRIFRNTAITKEVTQATFAFSQQPQVKVWNLFAGFEKAIVGAKVRPRQLLLVPQRPNPKLATWAAATNSTLQHIVEAAMHVLWTVSGAINQDSDSRSLTIDKYVISCYSQSGVDLWECAENNVSRIKAVVAIEPQNMNEITNKEGSKLGKVTIPLLLRNKVKVCVIGRHHTTKYRPNISADLLKQIRFLPDEPAKIFRYPPDPDSNDFVRYRVTRLKDFAANPSIDPLMDDAEEQSLLSAAVRVGSGALYSTIFHDEHNKDFSPDPPDGVERWYSHQYALSGGQIMELPADWKTQGLYGRPVTYQTFFQQVVEEIG